MTTYIPLTARYLPPEDRRGKYESPRPVKVTTSTGQSFRLTVPEARDLESTLGEALADEEAAR
jgi:hypothetical protein